MLKQCSKPASQSEGSPQLSPIEPESGSPAWLLKQKVDDLFRASTSTDTNLSDDCWLIGTPQRLNHLLAKRIFDLISTSTCSIFQLLKAHRELPPYWQLFKWKRKHPWFNEGWQLAREQQAEFLIQKTLDLAHNATPKTAHLARIQFDVYRFVASKFSPSVFGDKPSQTSLQVQLNVVSQEKLQELRNRLDVTRQHLQSLTPRIPPENSKS